MKILSIILVIIVSAGLNAGTILYRPNKESEVKHVSNVKIISIENKFMTIEIDGGRERIALSLVEGYYDTDLKSGGGSFDDNTPEYRVMVTNKNVPERPTRKSGNKLTPQTFDITYGITPIYDKNQQRDMVKQPYVYVYFMTEGSSDYSGERPIYLTCHPAKFANTGKKIYDKAAIMEKVQSSKRPNIYAERAGGSGKNFASSAWERSVKLPLNMAKNKQQKIIAWRLEIWGKNDIVYQDEWTSPSLRIGKNWWLRMGL